MSPSDAGTQPRGRDARDTQPIERAGPDDLDQLVSLENRCFDAHIAMPRRQYRYNLRNPNASVYVIRSGGRIVASAILLRRRGGGAGRLYSIAVDPDQRGKGLARRLLEDCLRTFQTEGIRAVVLEVESANLPAVRLYQTAGFEVATELPDYYGPGRIGLRMRRLL